jgi:hypothetical protein
VAVGETVQVAAVVPAQLPPVQAYEVGELLQLALRVALEPEVIDAGVAVTVHWGAGMSPMPLKLTACGLPGALLTIVTLPVRVPAATGLKVTLRAHVPPAPKPAPQLLV